MHALLEQIYRTGQVHDANGTALDPFPAATPKEVAQLLASIVSENRSQATLEVGLAYGLSTVEICDAHEKRGEGRHIAIDPMQSSLWKGVGLLKCGTGWT